MTPAQKRHEYIAVRAFYIWERRVYEAARLGDIVTGDNWTLSDWLKAERQIDAEFPEGHGLPVVEF